MAHKRINIKVNIFKNKDLIYSTSFNLIESNVEYWLKPNINFLFNDKLLIEVFENEILIEKRIL